MFAAYICFVVSFHVIAHAPCHVTWNRRSMVHIFEIADLNLGHPLRNQTSWRRLVNRDWRRLHFILERSSCRPASPIRRWFCNTHLPAEPSSLGNETFMILRIPPTKCRHVTTISAYVPTLRNDESTKDEFYEALLFYVQFPALTSCSWWVTSMQESAETAQLGTTLLQTWRW